MILDRDIKHFSIFVRSYVSLWEKLDDGHRPNDKTRGLNSITHLRRVSWNNITAVSTSDLCCSPRFSGHLTQDFWNVPVCWSVSWHSAIKVPHWQPARAHTHTLCTVYTLKPNYITSFCVVIRCNFTFFHHFIVACGGWTRSTGR